MKRPRAPRWAGLAAVALAACAARPVRTDALLGSLRPPGRRVPSADEDGGVYGDQLARLGREDLIATTATPAKPCRPLLRDGVAVDPLTEVVRRARDAQVVIVNEAHSQPAGRLFIARLAAALRPLGFSTYAAEAFAPAIGEHAPPYALSSDGYYVDEPVYGQLVRSLRTLGYRLVSYEWQRPPGRQRPSNPADDINETDEGMTENLIARIFTRDPHARVLIHVGYSHGRELPEDDVHWMGMRLKAKTGIDPLTIDQTSFGPAGQSEVTCAADGDGAALDPAFDVAIMPPALRFEHGRPSYRRVEQRHDVALPAALRKPSQRTLVEAHRLDDPDDAVPEDRVLLEPGDDLPLVLSPGRYRLRARLADGRWSPSLPLDVR